MTNTQRYHYDGGLDPEQDGLRFDAPDDPAIGENHGFWFFEDGGDFTFHVHVEANAPFWQLRREMVHVLLADGRVMSDWQYGRGTNRDGPGSACTRTRCIEPFARWELDYAGLPLLSDGATLARQPTDVDHAERVPVELELDIRMGADPWVQGRLTPGGMGADATAAIGGFRFEQLFRAEGRMRVGNERRAVRGTGLRTRRTGARDMSAFAGHSWQTVLFPGGRAFGFQRHYLPDGSISFDEAFITGTDGQLEPARVLEVPAMNNRFAGETVRTVLEKDGRQHVISGRTVALHHWSRPAARMRNRVQFGANLADPGNFILCNGCVQVEWDGETGYGLLERSARAGKLKG